MQKISEEQIEKELCSLLIKTALKLFKHFFYFYSHKNS